MSRTRFTPWVVLACIGTLAACTSTEGGPSGNTELNIILPNQGPGASTTGQTQVECNTVEYTIVCAGGEQPADGFLNPGDGFADAVTLNGNLEVDDDATPPVAQGYMDIPPGDCLVQLRCRDADDEVVCSGDNTLASAPDQNVAAGETQQVNIVLDCYNISYQAPVGQLDVRGDFIFSVGNFCPDLFVLNCVDTVLGPNGTDPGPEVEGETTCEVRFRDNDDGCNEGCDPQVCFEDTNGLLTCSAASPPEDQNGTSMAGVEVRTTVTCDRGTIDCLGAPSPGGNACTFDGDQLGTLAVNTEILPNDPGGPSAFGIACNPGVDAGQTITCEAYTTDGDRDCDKTKIVQVSCPGLTPCGTLGDNNGQSPDQSGGDAVCDSADGTVCRADVCNDATCDGSDTGVCCDQVNTAAGTDCSAENGGLPAECDGAGVCAPLNCTDDASCDDSNDCTVPQTCNVGTGICEPDPATNEIDGTVCDVANGSGAADGVCDTGVCEPFVCAVAGDCDDANPCTDDSCNTATPAGVCVFTPNAANSCTTCGSGNCECNGTTGTCDDAAPTLADVCAQYSPVPVQTTQTCDGSSPAETCICEKPEFIAIDCELLGNSAALPLQAAVQQLGVASAGTPLAVVPQDAIVLPATLVCGFIGAGFQDAQVANSFIENTFTNADITSAGLTSFLDDGTAGGALVSPHLDTLFQFGAACGDNCIGGLCNDGVTACGLATFTQDCPDVGTGPGIVAPFLANGPGSIPPGTAPVTLTPTAAGSVDIGLPYSGIALNLPDVGGAASGCAGGACGANGNLTPLCASTSRSFGANPPLDSPRVMYDSVCSKIDFGGGLCEPFDFFATLGDIVKGAGIDAVADFNIPSQLPSCTVGICGLLTTPTDFFCTSAAAREACATQLAADYPTATPGQLPQLWVN